MYALHIHLQAVIHLFANPGQSHAFWGGVDLFSGFWKNDRPGVVTFYSLGYFQRVESARNERPSDHCAVGWYPDFNIDFESTAPAFWKREGLNSMRSLNFCFYLKLGFRYTHFRLKMDFRHRQISP